jgi:hypothetical protein
MRLESKQVVMRPVNLVRKRDIVLMFLKKYRGYTGNLDVKEKEILTAESASFYIIFPSTPSPRSHSDWSSTGVMRPS